MTIVYRILSVFLNLIAALLFVSFILNIPLIFTTPKNLLGGFLLLSIILYTWFSNRFHRQVLQLQQPVKTKLRDWIRVNGIVTIIYSSLIIIASVFLFRNPQLLMDQLEAMPVQVTPQQLNIVLAFMLAYSSALLIHVLWTFALMKKHQSYFNDEGSSAGL